MGGGGYHIYIYIYLSNYLEKNNITNLLKHQKKNFETTRSPPGSVLPAAASLFVCATRNVPRWRPHWWPRRFGQTALGTLERYVFSVFFPLKPRKNQKNAPKQNGSFKSYRNLLVDIIWGTLRPLRQQESSLRPGRVPHRREEGLQAL